MKKLIFILISAMAQISFASDKVKLTKAPLFELKNQDGKTFKLADRAHKGWTVLFFFPKAGSPGCTTEVCSFRDSIKVIRAEGAEVVGISMDSVADQKKFHTEHHLVFDLLSDDGGKVVDQYGGRKEDPKKAKRDTYILDDKLQIRQHLVDVDPAINAQDVAKAIQELKHP